MEKKAFTLVELIIVVILLGIVSIVIFSIPVFFMNYINADLDRYNIYSQINYALEDMKTRTTSAIKITSGSFFPPGGSVTKSEFEFDGENDTYNITPDDLTDNAHYKYFVNATKELVLEKTFNGQTSRDILVEAKYKPEVEFQYTAGDEPNFLTVTINATNDKSTAGISKIISKTEGLRFWFVDVVIK